MCQQWAQKRQITLAYIHPGKQWQNGFAESFVGTYRREVLNAEIFMTLAEGQTILNMWLHKYNSERPHSRHNYRPPITAFNNHAA